MPVITNLRNPSLKGRHWEQIEQIVSHKFSPEEPLNLKLLTELSAFEHSEAIQEVSGQASAEAALETMLKKVCLTQRSMRYVFIYYRWRTHGNPSNLLSCLIEIKRMCLF